MAGLAVAGCAGDHIIESDPECFDDDAGFYTEPDWAPDGDQIVFTFVSYSDVWAGPELRVYSTSTGQVRAITPGHSPCWGPDSDRLAYSLGSELWTTSVARGEEHRITDFSTVFQPRWSPGGDRILVMRWAPSPGLWTIRPDGSDLRDLETSSFSADWDPTGTRVVFNTTDECELLVLDVATGTTEDVVDVSPDSCRYPRWSPNGGWISYMRFGSGRSALWAVRPDGSDERLLVEGAKKFNWSPNSDRIVFEMPSSDDTSVEILVYSMESDSTTRLLPRSPECD